MLSNILRVSLTTPNPLLQRDIFFSANCLALFGSEEVGEDFRQDKEIPQGIIETAG
jgi:hypothetical protein